MQIIISHVNTDFDALASMFAAKKLYPDAQIVLSDKQSIPVRQFLNIYRETLDFVQDHVVDWGKVTELIMVDVASLSRLGDHVQKMHTNEVKMTVFDHHPSRKEDVEKDEGTIETVGAAVTLLIEEIQKGSLSIDSFEATLFGLGIYTDTGSFSYANTTARDLKAASYLMEQGMNLEIVTRFSDEILFPEQQEILNYLFEQSTTHYIDGLKIVVSSYEQKTFQKGLATITQKILELTGADAVLSVVGMRRNVYVVGRASSERITLLPLLKKYHGGGHPQAGSATIKDRAQTEIADDVVKNLKLMTQPAMTAREMMTSPVKMILPLTSIEEAGHLMYRYGHSGFPVVEEGKLLGMITRRDLEKANHHGLGHAPVKAYMSTNVTSISPETTEEEIQKTIIERDIGRLPVVENGELIGIVSRTNVIQSLHDHSSDEQLQENLKTVMKEQLPTEIDTLLKKMSHCAQVAGVSVYLIGGIVRDLILGKPNDDIDIVVEGDGVSFAKQLKEDYGGEIVLHENFGTATWTEPTGLEIDITTSRLEFYDRPAALPDVETSTLKEDLYRRDFTINAMAIHLNQEAFGELIDPFRGRVDLQEKKIKTLHNLSYVEDPTRIFRGVRFELRFGFTMDDQTEKLALESVERVKDLSVDRMVEEMKRLFQEDHPPLAIQRLFELHFWQQYGVSEDRAEKSMAHAKRLKTLYKVMDSSNRAPWFSYFIIPFFHEGKLEHAKRFAVLKQETKFQEELATLQGLHEWKKIENIGELHLLLEDYSDEVLLLFSTAKEDVMRSRMLQYVTQRSHLPVYVTGNDLIKQGLKPSALFSKILLDLDVAILNEEITSKKEAQTWLKKAIKR